MSAGNLEALKTLDQGFRESKIKQLQTFLEDQRQLNIRLRKCSFDSKSSSNDTGKAHRLRPLSARPSTADPSRLASEDESDKAIGEVQRRDSRRSSKGQRRPSTVCGFRRASEDVDTSEEDSVFDALSITSLQSGTPSVGELGDIDELDETVYELDEANDIQGVPPRRYLSESSGIYASKVDWIPHDSYSAGVVAESAGDGRRLSGAFAQDGTKAKPSNTSRRKSASAVKYTQRTSTQGTRTSVGPNTISGITTIECPASLYKKIRHHSAPATRNDEIMARMNQQSTRPVGIFRLPPLATDKSTAKQTTDHSLLSRNNASSSQHEFIRTQQPLLKTEPIL